jgi:hypothetical protein
MGVQAKAAKENSIRLEVKKDGLQQRQNGDWMLRFTVAATDMDEPRNHPIVTAAMGARYQMVLVEINDDETPVDHRAKERDKWRELSPTQQAGIRCSDAVFWAFLEEEGFAPHDIDVNDVEIAAQIVRSFCKVASRSQLNKPGFHAQRVLWHQLDQQFQAWKAKENA